ncbi:MAG TPA: anti-sigma factor [Tepidiformaceae bacterium]|mgnify:FL=1|nr:anti-sigma factor [Tepidiformaceae bacterium]
MNRERAFELLPDFALNLLDDEEAAELRAYIESDPEARAELQVFLQASEALAFGGAEPAVPDEVRARIAAGTREKIDALSGGPAARPLSVQRQASNVVVGPWRAIAVGAAAAAFLMAIGLVAVAVAWLDARDEVDRLEGQLAARAIELPLSGDGVSGTIYVASNFQSGVARLQGLPPAPAEHHYQLWSEGPFGSRSAADFVGTEEGELLVELPALPNDMTRMFVTIEPDGATGTAPTGPEVMSTPR